MCAYKIIGWIAPDIVPLNKGADTVYVVDEADVDGCTVPIFIKNEEDIDTNESTRHFD